MRRGGDESAGYGLVRDSSKRESVRQVSGKP